MGLKKWCFIRAPSESIQRKQQRSRGLLLRILSHITTRRCWPGRNFTIIFNSQISRDPCVKNYAVLAQEQEQVQNRKSGHKGYPIMILWKSNYLSCGLILFSLLFSTYMCQFALTSCSNASTKANYNTSIISPCGFT